MVMRVDGLHVSFYRVSNDYGSSHGRIGRSSLRRWPRDTQQSSTVIFPVLSLLIFPLDFLFPFISQYLSWCVAIASFLHGRDEQ
jgi:hypothetical protein